MTRAHVVQSGECLTELAQRYGFKDAAQIYDHPANAALKRKRPSPNVLEPGDVVTIPDIEIKSEKLAVDRSHRVRVRGLKKELRIRLLDCHAEPIADEPYTLRVDGGEPVEGKRTGADGMVTELVPVGARSATLTIRERDLTLRFGALRPARDTDANGRPGIRARLQNLGYQVGSGDEQPRRRLRAAIAMFQHDQGLPLDGEVTDALVDRLIEVHGA